MSRSLLPCVIGLFLLLFASHADGQDYPMLHYTVEEGLPSNIVYSIYRDSKGFIWIATDKGIARFNGIKFETFTTFNGLPDNEIFFVQEDNYGRIWLGTFNGALCYYKNDSFHTAANTPFLKLQISTSHTIHISVEKDSTVIINFFDQSKFITINNERLKVFDLDSLNDPEIISKLSFRKKISPNRFKLICSDKIVVIDTSYKIVRTVKLDGKYFMPSRHFTACQDQEYLVNDKYVFTTDMQVVRTFPANFNEGNLHEIYIAGQNCLYTTDKGLLINDSVNMLDHNDVSAVTQDNLGNYWISTLSNGVFALRKNFNQSKLYNDVYQGDVRYACVYDNHIFFSTSHNDLFGLYTGKFSRLFTYDNKDNKKYAISDASFVIDSNYRYYNAYDRNLVVIDNVLAKKQERLYSDIGDATKAIFLSGDYVYTKRPHEISRIKLGKNTEESKVIEIGKSANFERIFGAAKAPDNTIWYSTINSMYKVGNSASDTDGTEQPQFRNIPFKSFDFFGNYLIGYTQNNELLVCRNYKENKIIIDTILPPDCIWEKLYRIDDDQVLISTNNLYRLLTIEDANNHGKPSLLTIENPFIPLHAEAIAIAKDNCYFFKNGSVFSLDINSLIETPDPPKLFFTTLKTSKKDYPIQDEMQLSYAESRHLSILFSTQSFGARDVHYEYSLSKTEQDNWRKITGEEIDLVSAGYGTYFIKVRATSISSGFSSPIVFTLHIARPYWVSWWFVSLCVLGMTFLTGIILRARILQVVHRKEKEHDTELKFMRSEYRTLNALMNPHFIFNTLNNVQGLINRNDKLAANEYIRVFADLVRQNMRNISKGLISLQREMELVSNYLLLEKLRFKDNLNYTIHIEEGVDLSEIMIPPLLIQPLVENSIKHGILPLESHEGRIEIDIYEREGKLYIDVKDNGVGMNAQKSDKGLDHESFGLENVRTRIEQLSIMQNKAILFQINEEKNDIDKSQWTIATIIIPI